MRIIVTGGRDWSDRDLVWANLDKWREVCGPREALTVVHGHCPTGADHHADEWTRQPGRHGPHCHERDEDGSESCYCPLAERHPADWPRCGPLCPNDGGRHRRARNGASYCPLAGHARNQKMADAGAIACLAFPTPRSRGTWDMIRRAEAAGIVVYNFGGDWP